MPQFVFSNIKLNGEFSIKLPESKYPLIKNHLDLLLSDSLPITNTFLGFFVEMWMFIENVEKMIMNGELDTMIEFFQAERGEVNSKQRYEFVKLCAVDGMNCFNRFGDEFFNEKAPQVLEKLHWKLGEVQRTTSFILLLLDYKSKLPPKASIDSSKVKEWFYTEVEKDWFCSARSAFTEQLRQPVWVKWILKVQKNKEERRLKEKLNAYEKAQLEVDVLFITAYSLFSEKAPFPSNFLEFFNEKYQDMVQLDLEKEGKKDLTKLKKKWSNAFELMKTFFSRSEHCEPMDFKETFDELDEDDVPQLEDQMDDDEEIVLQKGTFKFNCRG